MYYCTLSVCLLFICLFYTVGSWSSNCEWAMLLRDVYLTSFYTVAYFQRCLFKWASRACVSVTLPGFLQLCLLVRIISDGAEQCAAGAFQNNNTILTKQTALRYCKDASNSVLRPQHFYSHYAIGAVKNFLVGNISGLLTKLTARSNNTGCKLALNNT